MHAITCLELGLGERNILTASNSLLIQLSLSSSLSMMPSSVVFNGDLPLGLLLFLFALSCLEQEMLQCPLIQTHALVLV